MRGAVRRVAPDLRASGDPESVTPEVMPVSRHPRRCAPLFVFALACTLAVPVRPAELLGVDSLGQLDAVAPDPAVDSLKATAWEGAFSIKLAGRERDAIPIRMVNNDAFESDGRLGYHFAIQPGHDELSEIINALEPHDQHACTQDPALSSERYTKLSAGAEPGALTGTVILSWRMFDLIQGDCVPTAIPVPIQSCTVSGAAPNRQLTIVLAPGGHLPFTSSSPVQIVYRFSERPKTGDWKSWLEALAH